MRKESAVTRGGGVRRRPAGVRGRPILSLPALVGVLVLPACGGGEPEAAGAGGRDTADTLVDASGRSVFLADPPERIISLVPSATETLVALGAEDRLVARTDYDSLQAVNDLPSVGGGFNPSLEVLLFLKPDLVIRFAGETDTETPKRLDDVGIPHLAVQPDRVEDVRSMLRLLGRVVDREEQADSILARHRSVLDSIRTEVEGLRRIPAAFTLGGDGLFVAGPRTFVGELLTLAGGRNVFDDLSRPWAPVNPEEVLDRNPEVLLVVAGAELDPRLGRGRVVREVAPSIQRPGPGLDRAALEIARALRPDRFR